MATEKQMINALVAKVREVVHDVTNNDIILVLHNYDMDVQKTIQALCEDRENALGSWEHTGPTKTKSQKKKAKKAAKAAAAATAETSSSNGNISPSSSTPVSTPTPVVPKNVPVKSVARVPEPAKVEKKGKAL
uniref:SPATS2-like protein n=1 Tax=Steinernema glaseri TaxID=37863 RepID=A0A1I8A397_9BILA